jgi:hypothetical protein
VDIIFSTKLSTWICDEHEVLYHVSFIYIINYDNLLIFKKMSFVARSLNRSIHSLPIIRPPIVNCLFARNFSGVATVPSDQKKDDAKPANELPSFENQAKFATIVLGSCGLAYAFIYTSYSLNNLQKYMIK